MPGSAPAYEQDEGSQQLTFRGSITQRLISLSTLRSDGRPPPRKTRFPAAGPALPDGIGYPQGFNERFHIVEMIPLSRASWRKFVRRIWGFAALIPSQCSGQRARFFPSTTRIFGSGVACGAGPSDRAFRCLSSERATRSWQRLALPPEAARTFPLPDTINKNCMAGA